MQCSTSARTRFLLRHITPAIAAVALLLVFERTGVDSIVSGWFFDPVAHDFPLRHHFIMETVGHQLMKELVLIVCCCAIGLYLLSFVLPEVRPHRRVLLFLALGMMLAPLAVVLMKALSARHCPWDVLDYGGFAPHLSLFERLPSAMAPGHCFPGGHASAGFSLLAFYFAGHASGNRHLAALGLFGGLAAGFGFGMARVAQGAHFLSHNLWSAVVCWLVILCVYMVVIDVRTVPEIR